MKAVITILLVISCCISTTLAHGFYIRDDSATHALSSNSESRKTKVCTVIKVTDGHLITAKGKVPLAKNFRAYYRMKFGHVTEETDLSRVAGRRGTIQLINGQAAWIVIKTKEKAK